MAQNSMNDQTKKIVIGAAVTTAALGAGYMLYRQIKSKKPTENDILEKLKLEGNQLFKKSSYEGAKQHFTKAIEYAKKNNITLPLVAMLYQNRAACREKLHESPEDVLNDCLSAIQYDKEYAKAYLRAAKQLKASGKKFDALIYLMAAFKLDESLNKMNMSFLEDLMGIDVNDADIGNLEYVPDANPPRVSLYKIQQWWDTWDVVDLFKNDLSSFNPDADNTEHMNYKQALKHIDAGNYEKVLDTLPENISYYPAQILRAKFLKYSTLVDEAEAYFQNVVASFRFNVDAMEDGERKRLVIEAFDVLKIESCKTITELEKYLEYMAKESDPSRRFNLYTFSAISVYNGCIIDDGDGSHEKQMMSDMNNTRKYLKMASELKELTNHTKVVEKFVKFCSATDYSDLHSCILDIERISSENPTHFALCTMAKVYLLSGNEESGRRVLDQASSFNSRFLNATRLIQQADLYLNETPSVRQKKVAECAMKALEQDDLNFSAHILLLLGLNSNNAIIEKENYEESMDHIRKALVFASARERIMLKKMMPLMEAKKRAAELLNLY